jgi:hypothetical protein
MTKPAAQSKHKLIATDLQKLVDAWGLDVTTKLVPFMLTIDRIMALVYAAQLILERDGEDAVAYDRHLHFMVDMVSAQLHELKGKVRELEAAGFRDRVHTQEAQAAWDEIANAVEIFSENKTLKRIRNKVASHFDEGFVRNGIKGLVADRQPVVVYEEDAEFACHGRYVLATSVVLAGLRESHLNSLANEKRTSRDELDESAEKEAWSEGEFKAALSEPHDFIMKLGRRFVAVFTGLCSELQPGLLVDSANEQELEK